MWPTAVLEKISLLAYFFIIVAIKTNVINLKELILNSFAMNRNIFYIANVRIVEFLFSFKFHKRNFNYQMP